MSYPQSSDAYPPSSQAYPPPLTPPSSLTPLPPPQTPAPPPPLTPPPPPLKRPILRGGLPIYRRLKNFHDEEIKGTFYQSELQKVYIFQTMTYGK